MVESGGLNKTSENSVCETSEKGQFKQGQFKKGVLPLSADPPTLGHLAILQAAVQLFDQVVWAVGINPEKKGFYSLEQRLDMMRAVVADQQLDSQVQVSSYQGATLRYAQACGAKALIRGLRSASDFQTEFELASANRILGNGMQTCFFVCPPQYSAISATRVRELISLGENIQAFVPQPVLDYLDAIKNS